MSLIYQLPMQVPGMVGILPNQKFMVCGDSFATVTTAGYLNQVNLESNPVGPADILNVLYSYNLQTGVGTYGVFTVSVSNGTITLTRADSGGAVVTPTLTNYLIVSLDTIGTLGNYAGTVLQNGGIVAYGNISAGSGGTGGYFISYPGTSSKGTLQFKAVANTGNTATIVSNAAMGQASTISIPDPGVATTSFLLADNASGQTISTGNLTLTLGNIVVSAGTITASAGGITGTTLTASSGGITATAGNVTAGSSGNAGVVISYPTTASKGYLELAGVANTGNTATIISNAAMGQASTISIPDPGNSAAQFMVGATSTPFVSGNFPKASGTAGLFVDSGISIAPGSGLIGVPYVATVVLNTASVTGAYGTPVQIIAAPGANLAIIITSAVIITEVSTAFTSGGVAQLQYGNTVHAGGTLATSATIATAEITAASSQIFTQLGLAAATVLATATYKNLGIYFSNATQGFATGTSSTVTCVVNYYLVPST